MTKLFAPALAAALCLAASPALAQSITDDQANAMLDKLTTPAFDGCTEPTDTNKLSPEQQLSACQTALTELNNTRRANPRATPGEKEVYLFLENALEMGRTVALLRVDNAPTARVCANIERQWVLATSTNSAVVGPQLQDAHVQTRDGVRSLVQTCRQKHPAPKGAPSA